MCYLETINKQAGCLQLVILRLFYPNLWLNDMNSQYSQELGRHLGCFL